MRWFVPRDVPGRMIMTADWVGTLAFAVATVVATATLGPARYVAVGISMGLFAFGIVAFLWGYAVAVQRSREVEIGIGGLYFLLGDTAPKQVRWSLDGALAVQTIVAVASASIRPFTTLAFGILVPMFGIGMNGLWGAAHGAFGPRIVEAADESSPEGSISKNAGHG